MPRYSRIESRRGKSEVQGCRGASRDAESGPGYQFADTARLGLYHLASRPIKAYPITTRFFGGVPHPHLPGRLLFG